MNKMTGVFLIVMALAGCSTTTPKPAAQTGRALTSVQTSVVEIHIAADRVIRLNGQTVELAALGDRLKAVTRSTNIPVMIAVSDGISFRIVIQVMDQVKAAGFSKIGVTKL